MRKKYPFVLAVLLILAYFSFSYALKQIEALDASKNYGCESDLQSPELPEKRELTILSYNILRTKDQIETGGIMASDLTSNSEITPDFILWQEVMGKNDEESPEKLFAEKMGNYYSEFISKSGKQSGEGSAIISRYPFELVDHKVFPGTIFPPDFERVALLGEFIVPGIGYVRIINVHLSWINARARKSQVKTTLQWLEALEQERSADLTIFGGDFNAKPNSKPISLVMHNDYFDMKFYNFNDPSLGTSSLNSRIDYIFMAPLNPQLMEVVFERLIWTVDKLSDHVAILHKYRFYCSPAPGYAEGEE